MRSPHVEIVGMTRRRKVGDRFHPHHGGGNMHQQCPFYRDCEEDEVDPGRHAPRPRAAEAQAVRGPAQRRAQEAEGARGREGEGEGAAGREGQAEEEVRRSTRRRNV